MGKRESLQPSWWRDLDALIAANVIVRASCDRCRFGEAVDLDQLRARVGGGFCLVGRRGRCKIPDCDGHVRFFCSGRGRMEGMWTDRDAQRWMKIDSRPIGRR